MSRFAAAIVAFAIATAFVAYGVVRPELFIQLHDPNLLGGALFDWLLRTFGYAFVLALCACLAAAAVLLAAWRTRVRGASDWHVALAALLVVICLTGRLGISLDPVAWLAAAAIFLLFDRDDRLSALAIVAIAAVWGLLQGGATLAALLTIAAACASLVESKRLTPSVTRKFLIAGGCAIVASVQLHTAWLSAYGAHALYLDSMLSGAQRDRLWSGPLSPQDMGFAALVVVAAWYGIRRRHRLGDAVIFLALLVLSLADARNLPYFGIIGAPIAADALASYYVERRTKPAGKLAAYSVAVAAAACMFIAALTAAEPKATVWPRPLSIPMLSALIAQPGPHRVLCMQPRWCDAAALLHAPNLSVVLDDRAGSAAPLARRIQRDVSNALGNWQDELRRSNVDGILAKQTDQVVSLLRSTGWQSTITDGGAVLLQRMGNR